MGSQYKKRAAGCRPPIRKKDRHTKKGTAIRLCLFAMRMQLGVGRATPQNKEPFLILLFYTLFYFSKSS